MTTTRQPSALQYGLLDASRYLTAAKHMQCQRSILAIQWPFADFETSSCNTHVFHAQSDVFAIQWYNSILTVGTLTPQSNGPLHSNTVIGTLAVYGWAVTFGTARRGLGGLRPREVPSSLYQCNSNR